MTSARTVLRERTADAHARLHVHPAFAALAAGQTDRYEYRALLVRLYGFHAPLERKLEALPWNDAFGMTIVPRTRVHLLRLDLHDLDLTPAEVASAPSLPDSRLPGLNTPGRLLGCMYVREGSTIGGRTLARALDPLFGTGDATARRFLSGAPADAALWRDCCAAIEAASKAGHLPDMIAGANDTFDALETWLSPAA
ncbi:MAG TPA: biliverdin-producing heme oxygenase [Acidisphaera sp.]|nr:biliverdin-producing heme oxygenase [Acidisphaera sp.]